MIALAVLMVAVALAVGAVVMFVTRHPREPVPDLRPDCQAPGCERPAEVTYLRSTGVSIHLCRPHKKVAIRERHY